MVTTSGELRQIVRDISQESHIRTELQERGIQRNKNEIEQSQENRDQAPFSYHLPLHEVRHRVLDSAFRKYIVSLKLCMSRMDEVLDSLDKNGEWIAWEALIHYRKSIHGQIDSLMRLKKKTDMIVNITTSSSNEECN